MKDNIVHLAAWIDVDIVDNHWTKARLKGENAS